MKPDIPAVPDPAALLEENEQLKQRIHELEQEIARLQGKSSPSHHLTGSEKIQVYMDYFKGNPEVSAHKYWSNRKQKYG